MAAVLKPPPAPGRLDAMNLPGITQLMNHQNVRPGVDLARSEGDVIGRSAGKKKIYTPPDPVSAFADDIAALARDVGIDLDDDEGAPSRAKKKPAPAPRREREPAAERQHEPVRAAPLGESIDDLLREVGSLGEKSDGSSSGYGGSEYESGEYESEYGSSGSGSAYGSSEGYGESEYGSSAGSGSEYASSGSGASSSGSSSASSSIDSQMNRQMFRDLGIDMSAIQRRSKKGRRLEKPKVHTHSRRSRPREFLTAEQERRDHIGSVMSRVTEGTRTPFTLDYEREQDSKAHKLEQIAQLRMTLTEEGIDCSMIGNPSMNSSEEEINSVLHILRLKNDRNRYSTFAEEVILGLAEGLETVFDGTRALPIVGWKPDYTGYSSTVNVKLYRTRFETAQIVGDLIQKFRMGPTSRIVLELLPSLILYPRQQRREQGGGGGGGGLSKDPRITGGEQQPRRDASRAYADIHRRDTPSRLTELDEI